MDHDLPPVPEALRENLAFVLGDERAEVWLAEAVAHAQRLVADWELVPGEVLTGGSFSLCLRCHGADGAELVLKVPAGLGSGAAEIAALRAWGGDGAARLRRTDGQTCAMLMDFLGRVGEGEYGLGDIVDLAERLHRGSPAAFEFADVGENLARRVAWARERFAEVGYEHHNDDLDLAEKTVAELSADGGETVLLHGDLQAKNLILHGGTLTALDPMPVVGPAMFDLAFWIAKSDHARPTETYVAEMARLRPEIDEDALMRWTWSLAVLENRPYLEKGAAARQEFIDSHRPLVRA